MKSGRRVSMETCSPSPSLASVDKILADCQEAGRPHFYSQFAIRRFSAISRERIAGCNPYP